jgi:hypothetical protein
MESSHLSDGEAAKYLTGRTIVHAEVAAGDMGGVVLILDDDSEVQFNAVFGDYFMEISLLRNPNNDES